MTFMAAKVSPSSNLLLFCLLLFGSGFSLFDFRGVAWVTDHGVYIMGGENYPDGVTILKEDGTCQAGFELEPSFETEYL